MLAQVVAGFAREPGLVAQLREKGVLDQVVHLTKVGEGGALEHRVGARTG